MQLKCRSQLVRHRGGLFANLVPKEEYFTQALYTFDIGQSDLAQIFFGNWTIDDVNAAVPGKITGFSTNIKKLYASGARSFWIHNTGPLGCLPVTLKYSPPTVQRDEVGCLKLHNEVCQHFINELKLAVAQLRKIFPLVKLPYVDVYSVKYSLFKEPKKYGFDEPFVACCGNKTADCGFNSIVCKTPSASVSWDGTHYTEAAAKFVFRKISTGEYSDPPLPLKQACYRRSLT